MGSFIAKMIILIHIEIKNGKIDPGYISKIDPGVASVCCLIVVFLTKVT
jgi:hypothetical protein